ncbi:MAG: Na+/H+ antiporter NhaA [Endozoicomonadaceae bacterium]|nr:Na+/H+ antiporter NhaA [Endozoicomonadaceae bacterium]
MIQHNVWHYIKNIKQEVIGAIILFLFAIFAIFCANSSFESYYFQCLNMPVSIRMGSFGLSKPLLLWINDGLMAFFFFLIGMELKREVLSGELSDARQITLPAIGAIGGMLCPALIYLLLNGHDPILQKGWAIPVATDIAFALGVLSLLGSRVPLSLKVFLTSLAIFDDIGAIAIIAVCYTDTLLWAALWMGLSCLIFAVICNRLKVALRWPYLVLGILMWYAFLKSGLHATLAGFLLAFCIPFEAKNKSPLVSWEYDLQAWVIFFILPIFALANSGVILNNLNMDAIFNSVSLGIFIGLVLGKPLGVMLFCASFIGLGLLKKPKGVNWLTLLGASFLCGIGFTMSIFIGSLAFQDIPSTQMLFDERIGILSASFLSGILGFICIKIGLSDAYQT